MCVYNRVSSAGSVLFLLRDSKVNKKVDTFRHQTSYQWCRINDALSARNQDTASGSIVLCKDSLPAQRMQSDLSFSIYKSFTENHFAREMLQRKHVRQRCLSLPLKARTKSIQQISKATKNCILSRVMRRIIW